jgi:hypothetical protein
MPPTCSNGALDGLESDIDCGGTAGCAKCPAGLGCQTTADCSGLVSAAVQLQLVQLRYSGPPIVCTAGSSAPGTAASGGTCTDARLSALSYGTSAAVPETLAFALAFSGVPLAAMGALMARVAVLAAWAAVAASQPLAAAGTTVENLVLEAVIAPAQMRRRERRLPGAAGITTAALSYRMRLLPPPASPAGLNASTLAALLAGAGPIFADVVLASASQQLVVAGVAAPALSVALIGPIDGGAAFAAVPLSALLVEKGAPTGAASDATAGGAAARAATAAAAAAAVAFLLLVVGGALLCRARRKCLKFSTCCGRFPFKPPMRPGSYNGGSAATKALGLKIFLAPAPLRGIAPPNLPVADESLVFASPLGPFRSAGRNAFTPTCVAEAEKAMDAPQQERGASSNLNVEASVAQDQLAIAPTAAAPNADGAHECEISAGAEMDTETDEFGTLWRLDGPGGARLQPGWHRESDSTDVWYTNDETGDSSWTAPLFVVSGLPEEAFETDGPGGARLKKGWRRCTDETGDIWYERPGESSWDVPLWREGDDT